MTNEIFTKVRTEIQKILSDVKEFRHRIHEEPEIALAEYKTREKILGFLKGLPLEIHKPYIGTDVVADLKGRTDRTIVLRADIDALPLKEESECVYRSKIDGMMHACGHDGHTAILGGVARVLSALKDELPVSVRFVFQPGEERVAAGKQLVAAGALGNAEAAYALHGWPGLPVSAIQCREGVFYAAGSMFKVVIRGKGCHGAKPQNGINPIPIMARLVDSLYDSYLAVNKEDGSVITVCLVKSGTLSNIVPDTAEIQGTVRFLEEKRGSELEAIIRQNVADTIAGSGATAEIEYINRYDMPVVNSSEGYRRVTSVVEKYLPKGTFLESKAPTMGNEDFAFYLKDRKGAMVGLGQGNDRAVLHNCKYDFNDDTIETGMLFFSSIIMDYGDI